MQSHREVLLGRSRRMTFRFATFVTLAIALVFTSAVGAQSANVDDSNRVVGHVNILVYNLSAADPDALHATLVDGDTITVKPGEQLRFRTQTLTRKNASFRTGRYPSTLYTARKPLTLIDVDKVNEKVGSLTFTGNRRDNRAQRQVVDYQITQRGINITPQLRRGRLYVELADTETATQLPNVVTPSTQRGVTLFRDSGFLGRSEKLFADDPDLRDNIVGNDALSSIQLDRGCVARIFSDTGYRGEYADITFDMGDFGRLSVRNDEASSIQIRCDGDMRVGERRDGFFDRGRDNDRSDDRDHFRRGVTLYADSDFRGRSTFLADGSYADLDRSDVGNDRASSIAVSAGCVAILYSDSDFRGRSVEVDRDLDSLSRTDIGNDSLSSVRVLCR